MLSFHKYEKIYLFGNIVHYIIFHFVFCELLGNRLKVQVTDD